MNELRRWLEARLTEAPPSLRQRIERVLDRHVPARTTSLAQELRSLADVLLAEAKEGPASRETALTLLAADALVTYACEVTAESEPARLADLR